ncbi:MAG: FHA domain-containing protein, partial [Lentisphaeria bacterium]|nr:FHA domain-containing protein [Lentisphaeria bacterium]
MYQITLQSPNAAPQTIKLPDGVFLVGADNGNHLCLPIAGVSRVHCRLTVRGANLYVQDLNSSNGTFCDQRPVSAQEPVPIKPGSVLTIGSVQINTIGSPEAAAPAPVPEVKKPVLNEEEQRLAQSVQNAKTKDSDSVPILSVSGIPAAARPFVQQIKKQAHIELLKRLNLKRLAMGEVTEEHLEEKAKKVIHEILLDLSIQLPAGVTREKIEKELYYEAIGLGPLETLIAMNTITEIMVNGPD